MRCGLAPRDIPMGGGCEHLGEYRAGCIYEVPFESLALADAGTDATLKHVPRQGQQQVLDMLFDVIQPVQAATGPGAGPLDGQAVFVTAITINSRSALPDHSSSSGAGVTSNKYPAAAFARAVCQRAGGVIASLRSGEGTPWAQFGIHKRVLGDEDDLTVTIENQTGLAVDVGGVFVVYQRAAQAASGDA